MFIVSVFITSTRLVLETVPRSLDQVVTDVCINRKEAIEFWGVRSVEYLTRVGVPREPLAILA
jgi:hypothetical protein